MAHLSPSHAPSHLLRHLCVVYALLIVYASLHPFTGWRDDGLPWWLFLDAAWPRYWTGFDLIVNGLAYAPWGFFLAALLQPRSGRIAAVFLAGLCGGALSLGMETVQNYLPTRVASNLDLATNTAGAFLGGLGGVHWGGGLRAGGRWAELGQRIVGVSSRSHAGLMLLALWLLTQFNPEILLFGNGDLRGFLRASGLLDSAPSYTIEHFPWVEAGVTAGNTLAVGLFCSCLLIHWPRRLTVLLLLMALLSKALAMALLNGAWTLNWATKANQAGLIAGVLLWLPASHLPRNGRLSLAVLALFLATAFVNLAPENPYFSPLLQRWQQGHFLNFNGLTRWVSLCWPYAALLWLIWPVKPRQA